MTVAALSFDPVLLYAAGGLAGIVGIARLVLGWALST
jgi:hypothetical protein